MFVRLNILSTTISRYRFREGGGIIPFQKDYVTYSMWLIVLAILDVPRNVRQLFSNLMLVGIVPGKTMQSFGQQ